MISSSQSVSQKRQQHWRSVPLNQGLALLQISCNCSTDNLDRRERVQRTEVSGRGGEVKKARRWGNFKSPGTSSSPVLLLLSLFSRPSTSALETNLYRNLSPDPGLFSHSKSPSQCPTAATAVRPTNPLAPTARETTIARATTAPELPTATPITTPTPTARTIIATQMGARTTTAARGAQPIPPQAATSPSPVAESKVDRRSRLSAVVRNSMRRARLLRSTDFR
ncbi:uncharacterized protein CIMG_00471 [Coccidioides immitis RS]|uniref:Uncharacterized protein n=1 Tax=Coccidioides immitis (strain RS) TaxID=246410 RepID=J3KH24_COCIM|nr:uncharacterized protein CIMG_00471 [Coccidioides immitis RS]EAS35117.3 hypothetical protein CIMG_00471 [Coccidioides immitis RS]